MATDSKSAYEKQLSKWGIEKYVRWKVLGPKAAKNAREGKEIEIMNLKRGTQVSDEKIKRAIRRYDSANQTTPEMCVRESGMALTALLLIIQVC